MIDKPVTTVWEIAVYLAITGDVFDDASFCTVLFCTESVRENFSTYPCYIKVIQLNQFLVILV